MEYRCFANFSVSKSIQTILVHLFFFHQKVTFLAENFFPQKFHPKVTTPTCDKVSGYQL
jgi:hypothetical protein